MSGSEPTRYTLVTPAHTTSYLAAGPLEGPLIVFVHGWPALGRTWNRQLRHFARLGHRVIAPDLRGYGASTVHRAPGAYQQRHVVADLLALLDHLGRERAVWVGHDWGSPTVWALAGHHPQRCAAVVSLTIPYGTAERGLEALLPLVDRELYPADTHPFGQFDYMAHYEEDPERATAVLDADPARSVKAFFRRGNPAVAGRRRAPTATLREDGGWFGGADRAPDLPLDTAVLDEEDARALSEALSRNGFAGPTGYYLNHGPNAEYAAELPRGGRLDLPVLFVGADHDEIADTTRGRLAEPMRASCTDLTETRVPSGHWPQLEQPGLVNAQLEEWLSARGLRA